MERLATRLECGPWNEASLTLDWYLRSVISNANHFSQSAMDQSKAVLWTPPLPQNTEYMLLFEYVISAPKVLCYNTLVKKTNLSVNKLSDWVIQFKFAECNILASEYTYTDTKSPPPPFNIFKKLSLRKVEFKNK